MGHDEMKRAAIGVLISGRGSNLQSLIEAAQAGRLGGDIRVVISNRPGVAGLDRATAAGIEALTMPHAGSRSARSTTVRSRVCSRNVV